MIPIFANLTRISPQIRPSLPAPKIIPSTPACLSCVLGWWGGNVGTHSALQWGMNATPTTNNGEREMKVGDTIHIDGKTWMVTKENKATWGVHWKSEDGKCMKNRYLSKKTGCISK